MTGLLNEKEFSRKAFVKSGGALIVGFSLVGAGLAGKAHAAAEIPGSWVLAAESPYASNAPYDTAAVDSYLVLHADNTATLMSGYLDVGTGIGTGLLMIAAEELDMDVNQFKSIDPDTNVTPYTSTGSTNGVRNVGPLVRSATAYAKQALLGLASTNLGVPVASLSVASGVVSGGGKSVSYGELLGGNLFNVEMSIPTLQAGQTPAKPTSQYTLVGTTVPRIDIPAKVLGTYTWAQSITVPGMLHGRVVLPRGQGAYGSGAPVVSVDESSISHIPHVQLVRKNNFIGVVAPFEWDAIQAAAQLKVTWADLPPVLPGDAGQFSRLRELDSAGQDANAAYLQNSGVPNVDVALAGAAKVISQTYMFPCQGNMPIGPYCSVVDVDPSGAGARGWSFSQSLFGDRTTVAQALGMPTDQVHLIAVGGSSGFSASMEQPTVAAALMSQAVGKPVRVQMMRWDDNGWAHYSSPVMYDITGGIDSSGNMVAFNAKEFAMEDAYISPSLQLTGINTNYAANTAVDYTGVEGADGAGAWTGDRGVDGRYGVNPQSPGVPIRLLGTSQPTINNGLSFGAVESVLHLQSLFAWEQMVDELAHAANMDPMQFRLQNVRQMPWVEQVQQENAGGALITVNGASVPTNVVVAGQTTTARLSAILNKLAEISNWQPKVAASSVSNATTVTGRGMAWSSHSPDAWGATVADIEVNKKTGKVVVKQMYGVQDSGLAINPGAIEALGSGAMSHGVSRALYEEVRFTKTNMTSLDWVSYPILRFADSPNVTTALITNPALNTKSGAEELHDQVPATIANAFFDATGVRMRQAPLSPGRVRATLKAAGVA